MVIFLANPVFFAGVPAHELHVWQEGDMQGDPPNGSHQGGAVHPGL